MLPSIGFLGTRASFLMDVILVAVDLVPFILVYSISLVKKKNYQAHRAIQFITLTVVVIAVALFEFDIRLSPQPTVLAEANSWYEDSRFKIFLWLHIICASFTYMTWAGLAYKSNKMFLKTLPGSFSKAHKKIGKLIFLGACYTALSGSVIYYLLFVA